MSSNQNHKIRKFLEGRTCPICKGAAQEEKRRRNNIGIPTDERYWVECSACGGTGKVSHQAYNFIVYGKPMDIEK